MPMHHASWSIVSRISAHGKLDVPTRCWSLAHSRLLVYCIFVHLALNSKRYFPRPRLRLRWISVLLMTHLNIVSPPLYNSYRTIG